ncbi:MAG TPA: glycosyltransferase family 2 protein [Bryobacteraceae bacterium]|jgi:GT2 family glycosyltransferase|nr:glycosyltransferase family 2 protein [Bryobacteraceae bacterium]
MSEAPPDISVAVVNWNRREYLRACLRSLAAQRGADFEVIVVDNGSSDGSAEMARSEFGARVIANSANLGFCAANNQAIAGACGQFIALLNNDAEAAPDFLANLRRAFDAAPDIGMAAAKVLVWDDPRRIDKAGHLIYPDGQNRGRGTGEIDSGQYDSVEECLWPDGCAAMYRKTMLDAIGGFDEDFFMFADDAELGLRGRIAGWRCLYMPGAVARHHRGASLDAGSTKRIFLIERNRVLLAAKLFPWSLLTLNPYYFAVRLGSGLAAAAGGRGEMARFPGFANKMRLAWTILRADLAALPLLPGTLRQRREVRRIAKLTPGEIRRLILQNRIPVRALVEKSN